MTTFSLRIHIHWGCCVVRQLCASGLASGFETLLGIVHDELFTKGIDEILGSSGDNKLIRIGRSELYCVSYLVSPKSTSSTNQHRIVAPYLHTRQWDDIRMFTFKLVHRQELVEYAIVEHERHTAVCWVILYSKEALRSVVCLHIVHPLLGNELFILLTIGCEGNATMEEHL